MGAFLIRYLFGLLNASRKSIYQNCLIGLMIATVWFVYIQMIPYEEIISGGKAPRFADSVLECRVEPHNIKWFLVAFIILTVSCFCLIF
jgi:PiT family inorganic phosphate transporter